ncbi:hypothetical protein NT6N_17900 [Oceaniferula spumae]|uniref:Glycosyltransferase subfamily 4-like N-terminal domain-containing protein n=1 Tax=Oceaniferula spumae TaxID=2979115 RepID=A0AAT9FLA6_9BACT
MLADLASNTHKLDGLVLHGTFNPPMAAMGRHLRKHGIPYIFIPHDPYVEPLLREHRYRKALYWHLFEKQLISGSCAVQLLDASHEKPLRDMGCEVKTVVVPNGCEPEMLNDLPADARIPGVDSEETRILYFGRMDRNHKGLDLLLEGFSKVMSKASPHNASAKLIMTGNDWTDRNELEALTANLGITDQVTFTGRRPESAMEIVADADLVVLPSRFDGFGLCIVEAMLAARPVIVSSKAGVASHVEKSGGGWLTEPKPESIATTISTALDCKHEWKDKGLKNQAYVQNHLTWEQVAHQTRQAYSSVFT